MAIADLIGTLVKREVEFVIVGGMAAILRGTPVNTFDLDVVYERSSENIERLLLALDELQVIAQPELFSRLVLTVSAEYGAVRGAAP